MILGVESSCDESALALFDPASGLAGEWMHSQVELHGRYGGVVPDLASREHLHNFPHLLGGLRGALAAAGGAGPVSRVAVTCGPGLAACLAMGVALGKALALAWEVDLVGVNHLRGHAFSTFIGLHREDPPGFPWRLEEHLPHLGLLVSGGNTLLFEILPGGVLRVLAETVDDAAGEALDKGAKLLGLGYPGGPWVERTARGGDPGAFAFPRAFPSAADLRFSFSGLKTSLRYRLEKMDDATAAAALPDLCASYQEAVVDALTRKLDQAARAGVYASLGLSGGVANNGRLRERAAEVAAAAGLPLLLAQPAHTGDNAAMIAFAAHADPGGVIPAPGLRLGFQPALRLA